MEKCATCGKVDHSTENCKNPPKVDAEIEKLLNEKDCNVCGKHGHPTYECPKLKFDENTDGDIKCLNCGATNHYASQCGKPQTKYTGGCVICGKNTHKTKNCKKLWEKKCGRCGSKDH